MRYYGNIYRPPSEAYSLLLQVTIGCSHNKCTFCSMYKDKNFSVRPMEDILWDLEDGKNRYPNVERVFLCDGDALCLSNNKLVTILKKIKECFPSVERVSTYARAKDILRKTDDELIELRDLGLTMAYIGAESGSDIVLKKVNKGETADEIIESVKKLERNKITTSVSFISGLAGPELLEEHAIKTGEMISKMGASYVSLLTLMLESPAPIVNEYKLGNFKLLKPYQVLKEAILILENAKPEKSCVFRANHASNYVSLRGNLPEDNERLICLLNDAINNPMLLKDERFRAL